MIQHIIAPLKSKQVAVQQLNLVNANIATLIRICAALARCCTEEEVVKVAEYRLLGQKSPRRLRS